MVQHKQQNPETILLLNAFSVLFAIPLVVHFKEHINILWIQIFEQFHHARIYTAHVFHIFLALYRISQELRQLHPHDKKSQCLAADQILKEVLPPPDEFITEQLTISISTGESDLSQDTLQPEQEHCESDVIDVESSASYQPDLSITCPPTPPVVNSDCASSEFIGCEDRCSKFINQDLSFLQSSKVPPVSKKGLHQNNPSAQVSQSQIQVTPSIAKPVTSTSNGQNSIPPTQKVEPVLGFTPAEIRRAEAEPKLTVEQLLELDSRKEYVKNSHSNFRWHLCTSTMMGFTTRKRG